MNNHPFNRKNVTVVDEEVKPLFTGVFTLYERSIIILRDLPAIKASKHSPIFQSKSLS